MKVTEGIDTKQQKQVVELTDSYVVRARQIFERNFDLLPVNFNLKGRSAGMYKVTAGQRLIRYNPYIFAKYFEENLKLTIPHEVAHYITDEIYGTGRLSLFRRQRIRPHGPEWKSVMHEFGADICRTFSFDISDLPQRRYKTYSYVCGCKKHQLGSRRHMRVVRNQALYHCPNCKGELQQLIDA